MVSRFDRKNYFYADLPAGYQISQYRASRSSARARSRSSLRTARVKQIGITRLHLEQDAGKSLHDQHPTKSYHRPQSRRRGADGDRLASPTSARRRKPAPICANCAQILRYLGTCDGNMEEGSMRADVNVSVRKPGEEFRTRCEIKNVNSVRFVMQAMEAEAVRQVAVWEAGGEVGQETRLYEPARGETRSMRSKEDAHDYRYFPEPDLLPLVLDEAWVAGLKAKLPELPDEKTRALLRGIRHSVLRCRRAGGRAGDGGILRDGREGARCAGWPPTGLWAIFSPALNRTGGTIENPPVSADGARRAARSDRGHHHQRPHRQGGVRGDGGDRRDPAAIVEEKGLRQVTDTGAIDAAVAPGAGGECRTRWRNTRPARTSCSASSWAR